MNLHGMSLCNWVDQRIEVECRQIWIFSLYEHNVWKVIPYKYHKNACNSFGP